MTQPPYESSRECAICEEEGDASAPLRWRWTLNRAHKLLVHTACYEAEVAHASDQDGDCRRCGGAGCVACDARLLPANSDQPKPYLCGCLPDDPQPCPLHGGGADHSDSLPVAGDSAEADSS